jgi:hypothetical protein
MEDDINVLLVHSNLTVPLHMAYFEMLGPLEYKIDEVCVPIIVRGHEDQDVGPAHVREMLSGKKPDHYSAVLVHPIRKDLAAKVREEGYQGPIIGVEFDRGEELSEANVILTGSEMARDIGLLKRTIEEHFGYHPSKLLSNEATEAWREELGHPIGERRNE